MTKTSSTLTTLQPLSIQQPQSTTESWSLLLRAVIDHHTVHRIERQESNCSLAQALLSLYDLGADTPKINNMYHILAADLEPASPGYVYINSNNWKENLGHVELYRDFIDFFDREIDMRGLEATFELYFPSLLDGCLGSHVLGIKHIGFGMEHCLPTVVSEGMAHICTTFLDISDMLSILSTSDLDCDEVLDMIRCDQRFDGRLPSNFVNNCKLLLNSRRDLLKTYMRYMRTSQNNISDRHRDVEELIVLATRLIQAPAETSLNSPPCSPTTTDRTSSPESVNYLLNEALLSSALAVSRILPFIKSDQEVKKLVNFQRLLTICTYIVQGRPPIQCGYTEPTRSWEECRDIILKSNNMRATIILRDLSFANKLHTLDSLRYLNVANLLSEVVDDKRQCHKMRTPW